MAKTKKVTKLKVKKPTLPTKTMLQKKVQDLVNDRAALGGRMTELIIKANRLAVAHTECKDQMRTVEIDLLNCDKELRDTNKKLAEW